MSSIPESLVAHHCGISGIEFALLLIFYQDLTSYYIIQCFLERKGNLTYIVVILVNQDKMENKVTCTTKCLQVLLVVALQYNT
jgi:hypothetical protein